MTLATATLPGGRTVYCLNPYEVEYSVKEIFEEDLTRFGIDLPPGGTYYDVGANIGLFAIYLADRCPDADLYGYEPIPMIFEALEKNLAGLPPGFRALDYGLGAVAGELAFDYYPGITGLSNCNPAANEVLAAGLRKILLADEAGHPPEFVDGLLTPTPVRCRVARLSDELAARGPGVVDLLKIDTEGAEDAVLAGLDEADWPRIRQLMVEVHLGPDALARLDADLTARGYRTARADHPMAAGGAPVFHLYATRGPRA